jgi:hypothetical protein
MAAMIKYGRIEDLAKETDKPRMVLWAPQLQGGDTDHNRSVESWLRASSALWRRSAWWSWSCFREWIRRHKP